MFFLQKYSSDCKITAVQYTNVLMMEQLPKHSQNVAYIFFFGRYFHYATHRIIFDLVLKHLCNFYPFLIAA